MRKLLLSAALIGLCTASVHAEPVQLNEGDLQEVAAGIAPEAANAIGISVTNPVTVSAPVNVSNQINVANQVATGVAVGVQAAIAAFSSNVTASGATNTSLGLSTGP